MKRPGYSDIWFAAQGLQIYDPTRHIFIVPPKIQPPSGVYKRWERLKRKSLYKKVFVNRLIVWGISFLTFVVCMFGFALLAHVLNARLIALAGGYLTFNVSLFLWHVLEERFPQHWYDVK